ncbi:MAG: PRC-barrel domain-containing protein [Candidatus Bathyarchaeia archaeon]|nr:PRC-barrel domain-containing protein [Candidatus Bathyarchaeota archaeon]
MNKYYLSEDIAGKEVIDESEAKKVGTIRDIAFTMDGKVAFIVEAEDKKGELMELFLPFEKIVRVGDVVIIKSIKDLEKPTQ